MIWKIEKETRMRLSVNRLDTDRMDELCVGKVGLSCVHFRNARSRFTLERVPAILNACKVINSNNNNNNRRVML